MLTAPPAQPDQHPYYYPTESHKKHGPLGQVTLLRSRGDVIQRQPVQDEQYDDTDYESHTLGRDSWFLAGVRHELRVAFTSSLHRTADATSRRAGPPAPAVAA